MINSMLFLNHAISNCAMLFFPMYLYGQIALAIACAITGHTRTSESTDYIALNNS